MSLPPRNRRILVVDDNRAIHEDFKKILVAAPGEAAAADLSALERELFDDAPQATAPVQTFEVTSAHRGEEALALVQKAVAAHAPFAVAFVDMRMPPGWDGVRTIEELWKVDAELQVVICTAYSDHAWEDVLARLGVNDRLLLLKKPFDTAEVCQLACALTEKWHLSRHAHLKLAQLRSMVEEQTESLARGHELLKQSERRYALAAAGANDGLWDWSLDDDAVYYSPRWKGMLGVGDQDVAETRDAWWSRIHPDDLATVEREFEAHRHGHTPQLSVEYRILHRDGKYRWMLCRGLAFRDESGRARRIAGSQSDITDRKVAEAQLRHAAFHDPLTGLPNRALLAARITDSMERAAAGTDARFAVMCIDLDRFKVINDSLGHPVGDALLVAVSRRFSAVARAAVPSCGARCEVFRMGGDEFVILLDGLVAEESAASVADALLASLADPIDVEGQGIHTSLSIGIAVGVCGVGNVEDLLRDADTALYQAKADGRGCHRSFHAELHTLALARWEKERDLRLALDRGELQLHYQPVVSIDSGEVAHFEALLRWKHPTRGFVMPTDFISLAEETGLIVQIGQWALEEACRQVTAWRAMPGYEDISVAVNVSSTQFVRPTFADEVAAVLRAAETPSSALKLEITENATMSAGAISTCEKLEALGVQLHLDDFGTGYSSLSYLHRMPIHALKVDRSFVGTAHESKTSASIIKTVLALANALGMEVVAEGIEEEAQLELLRGLGCRLGQGYLWARALDAASVLEMLTAQDERALALAS